MLLIEETRMLFEKLRRSNSCTLLYYDNNTEHHSAGSTVCTVHQAEPVWELIARIFRIVKISHFIDYTLLIYLYILLKRDRKKSEIRISVWMLFIYYLKSFTKCSEISNIPIFVFIHQEFLCKERRRGGKLACWLLSTVVRPYQLIFMITDVDEHCKQSKFLKAAVQLLSYSI